MFGVGTGYATPSKAPQISKEQMQRILNCSPSTCGGEGAIEDLVRSLANCGCVIVAFTWADVEKAYGLPDLFFTDVYNNGHNPRSRAVVRDLIRRAKAFGYV